MISRLIHTISINLLFKDQYSVPSLWRIIEGTENKSCHIDFYYKCTYEKEENIRQINKIKMHGAM